MIGMFRIVVCLLILASLASCSTLLGNENTVQRISQEGTLVAVASDGRYDNLYKGFEDYPFTCSENCYTPHPDLRCEEAPAVRCTYQGTRPSVATDTGFTIQWLGHASFLITDTQQHHFLIDPVSGQFDWPVNWAHNLTGGFSRNTPDWLDDKALASVDAVLYSHLHYDHFNVADIHALGNGPRYFVHQDSADYLPEIGLNIAEMSWYSATNIGETRVHAMPAHHFNSRIYVPYFYEDNERALWGGWMLEQNGKTLFFAGDTGYSPHFRDIHNRYGDIDICLLPIASYYHPEYSKWYRYVHTTPEDSLLAAQELGCGVVIPWGYGNTSWQMGDHSSHSALLRLLNMHTQVNPTQALIVLTEGETISL